MGWEKMMKQRGVEAIFLAVIFAGCVVAGAAPASAQTFQSYRCADGTRFLAAFYQYDSRAFLQIDGGAVTLPRRLNWSGTRYSGGGITLTITKAGIAVKHARRPSTACEVDVKQP
jgi:membrane-bound inhibitor of C-type lysozyme